MSACLFLVNSFLLVCFRKRRLVPSGFKALVRGFKHCLLLCTSVHTETVIWDMKSKGREVEPENNSKGNLELKGVKRNTKHIKEKSSKKKKTGPV